MSCGCDDFLKGYKQLTTYTQETESLPPSQKVVEHSAVQDYTVPSTTEFISLVEIFHSSIWDKVVKNAGILRITVLSGTVKILTVPMGSTGAVDFGEASPEIFILESHELMGSNWASPDGAIVRVEAYGKETYLSRGQS